MKALIVVLVILAGCAGIYFSLDQQTIFEETIKQKLGLRHEQEVQTAVLRETEAKRGAVEKERDSWLTQRSEAQTLVQNETQQGKDLGDKLVSVTKEFDSKHASIQQLIDELAQYNISDPQELVDLAEEAKKTREELKTQLEEKNTLLAAINKKVAGEEGKVSKLQQEQKTFRDLASVNRKEFSVTEVDPEWGFVVVNGGSSSELDPAGVLLVTRGGRNIAKLKITSLEKRQLIADIVPGSLSPGNRVEVGDQVMLLNPRG